MSNIKDETMMFNFGADDDKAAKHSVFPAVLCSRRATVR